MRYGSPDFLGHLESVNKNNFLSLKWLDRTWENYISLESAWPAASDKNKKKNASGHFLPRDLVTFSWSRDLSKFPYVKILIFVMKDVLYML